MEEDDNKLYYDLLLALQELENAIVLKSFEDGIDEDMVAFLRRYKKHIRETLMQLPTIALYLKGGVSEERFREYMKDM